MTIRRGISVLGAMSLLLAACAQPPKYSGHDDPFKSMSPKSERKFSSAKLCLLLTENTNLAMAHVSEVHGMMGMLGAPANEFDPKRLVADLTETLETRFRETVRARSLEEGRSLGCNVSLALDLKIKVGTISFQDITVDMTGALADDKGARLDSFSGKGGEMVPFPNTGPGGPFATAWGNALKEFETGLDKSQPLAAFVAGLPKYAEPGPAAVSAPAPAPAVNMTAVDMAFWDSVKVSKNPADFQAYLQKFPNGSFANLARTRLDSLGEAAPPRLTPLALPADGKIDFGSYHALVIGNNDYRFVTPLATAVNDARTVAELLEKDYGFKVSLLLNATRNQTLDAFDDLRRTLTDRDNLLIFYAGHGYLDHDSDRGFWMPVDADGKHRANWLSNSDLADFVRAARAKHVLVVADSCYAGTLTRNLSVQMTGLDAMWRLAQKRARTALVSGGLEPVEDSGGGGHSVFAKAFLDSLRSNTGVVDTSQIFSSMRRQVILGAQQTPQYGDIRQTGHEGGDFIFVRKK
ncbi:MAG: caspase family protein [Alphaproteobacteria bacterium]|nr:caspase family protein [Alphaproteobacteria bacterium]